MKQEIIEILESNGVDTQQTNKGWAVYDKAIAALTKRDLERERQYNKELSELRTQVRTLTTVINILDKTVRHNEN